jgi:hypothetical protein
MRKKKTFFKSKLEVNNLYIKAPMNFKCLLSSTERDFLEAVIHLQSLGRYNTSDSLIMANSGLNGRQITDAKRTLVALDLINIVIDRCRLGSRYIVKEETYNELVKHADIVFFFQHTEQEIADLESYSTVWTEECETAKLSAVWQTGFLYPNKDFKADHSHVSELQAYTKGRNTLVTNRMWTIFTKKEKTTFPAWHPTKGMIMHDFAYTSDVWHTTEAVAPKSGVIQAKVRTIGKAKHVFCLTTINAKKSLHLLPANHLVKEAIYTLVWNEQEVVNYVNNVEVSRTQNPLADKALHLLVRSYLPQEQKGGTGQMDIDWIRIYTK